MRLASRSWGESGRVVVLLHGLYGRKEEWHPVARSLAKWYRVVALDLRNHGASPHVPNQGIRQMGEDVRETLEALGIHDFFLVGHSMGARVAMHLAPGLATDLRGLVSLDAPIPGVGLPPGVKAMHRRWGEVLGQVAELGFQSVQEVGNFLRRELGDEAVAAYIARNFQFRNGVGAWRFGLEGVRDFLRGEEPPAGPELPPEVPFLLIRAGNSPYCQQMRDDLLAAWAQRAENVIIPDVGHFLHYEARAEVIALIHDFFTRNETFS